MTITRSSKFLVQSVTVCFLLLYVGHSSVGELLLLNPALPNRVPTSQAPRTTLSKSRSRSNPTRAFTWAASGSNDLTGRWE